MLQEVIIIFLVNFLVGQGVMAHVAHIGFLRDVWIGTQSAA
jgi:hypothetical protein